MVLITFLAGCQKIKPTHIPTMTSPVVSMTRYPLILPATEVPTTAENSIRSDTPTPIKGIFPTSTLDLVSHFELCSPLADHLVSDLFGIVSSPYDPPPMGKDDRHQGVDFAYYNQRKRSSIEGEGIQAITAGWVASVIEDRLPYGNMVIMETPWSNLPDEVHHELNIGPGESLYHLYAHMNDTPLPSIGSWVECGQIIGHVGKSGYNVPVAHLHLETRIGPSGTRFNEMVFYDTRASIVEMENYKTWRMSGIYWHFDPMTLFKPYGFEAVDNE